MQGWGQGSGGFPGNSRWPSLWDLTALMLSASLGVAIPFPDLRNPILSALQDDTAEPGLAGPGARGSLPLADRASGWGFLAPGPSSEPHLHHL